MTLVSMGYVCVCRCGEVVCVCVVGVDVGRLGVDVGRLCGVCGCGEVVWCVWM